jgi:hypothetical protein
VKTYTSQGDFEVLLRCEKTHRYVRDDGWTFDPNEATHFSDGGAAVRTCVKRGLREVELVFREPELTRISLACRSVERRWAPARISLFLVT